MLVPKSKDPVDILVLGCVEHEEFCYETRVDDVSIRVIHRLSEVRPGSDCLPRGGTKITHRCEITGASADRWGPAIGPDFVSGIPAAVNRLAELAGQRSGTPE
ncbi:hypothetical protein I5Q34_33215 [Streptomyces sp. AV19]|uniref:hypothetical protein n=1 Tax=Streptomyces sp. AV19 TaxID=2793068 RepID=UPI0018FEBBE7|nr:hypothetical protein [Streptomyces sp. AV19]MBH1939064.1 hypothetical protein [Streptomyces sp. AV19]MDG4536902.1 hypothetical protein [Streptomyces sp. AV19]